MRKIKSTESGVAELSEHSSGTAALTESRRLQKAFLSASLAMLLGIYQRRSRSFCGFLQAP